MTQQKHGGPTIEERQAAAAREARQDLAENQALSRRHGRWNATTAARFGTSLGEAPFNSHSPTSEDPPMLRKIRTGFLVLSCLLVFGGLFGFLGYELYQGYLEAVELREEAAE